MKKKRIILAGVFLAAFLMLMTPCVNAVNVNLTEETIKEKLQNKLEVLDEEGFLVKLGWFIWGLMMLAATVSTGGLDLILIGASMILPYGLIKGLAVGLKLDILLIGAMISTILFQGYPDRLAEFCEQINNGEIP